MVRRLGRFLPLAIMLLLVLHSALGAARAPMRARPGRNSPASSSRPPCRWRKNALLSILAGTGLYVLLRNGFGTPHFRPATHRREQSAERNLL